MTNTAPAAKPFDLNDIALTLKLLYQPGDVAELRMLKAVKGQYTAAGYFDDMRKLAQAAARYSGKASGIYVTINPVSPDLLARLDNTTSDHVQQGDLTQNEDVLCRRWLLVDLDPERKPGISSTDAEHNAALAHAARVRDGLRAEGWPEPIYADSGNGAHLLYRIDEPTEDDGLIGEVLKALAMRYGTPTIHLDTGVQNAARISKLYGTMVRKGANRPERPHRIARIIEAPIDPTPVPHDLLTAMANSLPTLTPKPTPAPRAASSNPTTDLEKARRALERLAPWRCEEYQPWSEVGMALSPLGEPGFELWDRWSQGCEKYDVRIMRAKWDSFDPKGGLGLGSLFMWAKQDDPGGDVDSFNYGLPDDPYPDAPPVEGDPAPVPQASPTSAPAQARGDQQQPTSDEFPEICMNKMPQHERMAVYEDVLLAANKRPFLFVRAGALVNVRTDEKGNPSIEPVTKDRLGDLLCSHAYFYLLCKDPETNKPDTKPTQPSERDLAEYLTRDHHQFPPLEAIIEAPTLRPDGTIITQPGYDAVTRLYYHPDKTLHLPSIPDNPTQDDARASAALLLEAIVDFPFQTQPSRANALAMFESPIVRPALTGHIPAAAIDAPDRGAGKGMLTNLGAVIATGREAAVMNAPKSEEEMAKTLTTLLLAGSTFNVIDNLTGVFDSAQLATFLTADTWQQRLLGGNVRAKLPQRSFMILNGNNLALSGDLPRRCYWIRLDPKTSRPWRRTGFLHDDLISWAKERRGDLLAACLTMARAWYVAGKPAPTQPVENMGTFTPWARTMAGILAYAGVEGFLQNEDEMFARLDTDTSEWGNFLEAWYEFLGNKPVSVADLLPALMTPYRDPISDEKKDGQLNSVLPHDLLEAVSDKGARSTKIGTSFRDRNERVYPNGYRLEHAGTDGHAKRALWRVVRVFAGGADSADSPITQSRNEGVQQAFEIQGSAPSALPAHSASDKDGGGNGHNGNGHNGHSAGGASVGAETVPENPAHVGAVVLEQASGAEDLARVETERIVIPDPITYRELLARGWEQPSAANMVLGFHEWARDHTLPVDHPAMDKRRVYDAYMAWISGQNGDRGAPIPLADRSTFDSLMERAGFALDGLRFPVFLQ